MNHRKHEKESFGLKHGTIKQTGKLLVTCTTHFTGSVLLKKLIFWSYFWHLHILAGVRKCWIVICQCK